MDNFSYEYFSGTNRLRKLNPFQAGDDFSYDGNGNVTKDEISFNYDIKYDHRNLPVQMRNERVSDHTLWIRYWYDESGNRVRKLVIKSILSEHTEPSDWETPQAGMEVIRDEYYVRDISGKEIAVYSGRELVQWNFY